MSLTTIKTAPGTFDVLWNGKPTRMQILNGSVGLSGRDTTNTYGIVRGSQQKWIGTLPAAKKMAATWCVALETRGETP